VARAQAFCLTPLKSTPLCRGDRTFNLASHLPCRHDGKACAGMLWQTGLPAAWDQAWYGQTSAYIFWTARCSLCTHIDAASMTTATTVLRNLRTSGCASRNRFFGKTRVHALPAFDYSVHHFKRGGHERRSAVSTRCRSSGASASAAPQLAHTHAHARRREEVYRGVAGA